MATIKAKIIEGMSGDPLPSASIQLVNANGVSLGQGVYADNNGQFALTSDKLTGNFILVSYTGLQPVLVDTSTLNDSEYKEIDLFASDLEAVIVTPNKKNPLFWLLLIGLGAIAVTSTRKRKTRTYAR